MNASISDEMGYGMDDMAGLHFGGSTFVPERDGSRLAEQTKAVFSVMKDGQFRTLSSLAQLTSAPEASVSARLRDLRKPRFGGHTVNREYLGRGLFQYQLVVREASH